MTDTLLVDGTDIQSSKRIIQMWDEAVGTRVKRGENIVIPYAVGELYVPKFNAARDISIGMLIKATSYADLNAEIDALYAILPSMGVSASSDTSCTLTRRRTYSGGTTDTTAEAEYLGGITPTILPESDRHARLTIRFRLLTGGFA